MQNAESMTSKLQHYNIKATQHNSGAAKVYVSNKI